MELPKSKPGCQCRTPDLHHRLLTSYKPIEEGLHTAWVIVVQIDNCNKSTSYSSLAHPHTCLQTAPKILKYSPAWSELLLIWKNSSTLPALAYVESNNSDPFSLGLTNKNLLWGLSSSSNKVSATHGSAFAKFSASPLSLSLIDSWESACHKIIAIQMWERINIHISIYNARPNSYKISKGNSIAEC